MEETDFQKKWREFLALTGVSDEVIDAGVAAMDEETRKSLAYPATLIKDVK